MNWVEADHFCQILKSHLVEIDSPEENEAITEELKARRIEHQNTPAEFDEFWLGLTDFKTLGADDVRTGGNLHQLGQAK